MFGFLGCRLFAFALHNAILSATGCLVGAADSTTTCTCQARGSQYNVLYMQTIRPWALSKALTAHGEGTGCHSLHIRWTALRQADPCLWCFPANTVSVKTASRTQSPFGVNSVTQTLVHGMCPLKSPISAQNGKLLHASHACGCDLCYHTTHNYFLCIDSVSFLCRHIVLLG